MLAAGHPEIFGYRWEIRWGCVREPGAHGGLLLLFFFFLLYCLSCFNYKLLREASKNADLGLLDGFI